MGIEEAALECVSHGATSSSDQQFGLTMDARLPTSPRVADSVLASVCLLLLLRRLLLMPLPLPNCPTLSHLS